MWQNADVLIAVSRCPRYFTPNSSQSKGWGQTFLGNTVVCKKEKQRIPFPSHDERHGGWQGREMRAPEHWHEYHSSMRDHLQTGRLIPLILYNFLWSSSNGYVTSLGGEGKKKHNAVSFFLLPQYHNVTNCLILAFKMFLVGRRSELG